MELIEYVRENRGRRKGQLRGVVIANRNRNGEVKIGWSFTRTSPSSKNGKTLPGDQFNKEKGLMIARARVELPTRLHIPQAVQPVLERMEVRASKYFQVDL